MKDRNFTAEILALPQEERTVGRIIHKLGQAIETRRVPREPAQEAARRHSHRVGLSGDGHPLVFADTARSRTWQDQDPILRLAEHIASTLDDENQVPELKTPEQIQAAQRQHVPYGNP